MYQKKIQRIDETSTSKEVSQVQFAVLKVGDTQQIPLAAPQSSPDYDGF